MAIRPDDGVYYDDMPVAGVAMAKTKNEWKARCEALCKVVEGFLLVLFYVDVHGQLKRINMPPHIAVWLDRVEDMIQDIKDAVKEGD